MKLNELEIKTTNGFKINNLEIDLDLNELNTTKLYEVNDVEITQTIKEEKLISKVGLEFNKYLELKINIKDNNPNPLIINYNFINNDNLISNIIIDYDKYSSRDIFITYKSLDNNKHFNNIKEVLNAKEYSKGNITYINLLNNISTNIISFEDKLLEESDITHNLIDIGANIKIYNSYMESIGYKSKNTFNNIYIGKENNIIDINYNMKNIGKLSTNNLKVEGALLDNSIKTFRGTIDFIEGCTKSNGIENENCVLLSDTCISKSLPMLLCHEEDVTGAHGESVGKINEDKLFYLMSRGISKKDAERLIVIANFTSILNEINNDSIKEEILNIIENLI